MKGIIGALLWRYGWYNESNAMAFNLINTLELSVIIWINYIQFVFSMSPSVECKGRWRVVLCISEKYTVTHLFYFASILQGSNWEGHSMLSRMTSDQSLSLVLRPECVPVFQELHEVGILNLHYFVFYFHSKALFYF